jgi:glycopeptide antibiotics resistance protein
VRIFGFFILALISYGSVYPFQIGGDGIARLPQLFSVGSQITTDIIENILAFIPVGAAFAIKTNPKVRRSDYKFAVLIAVMLQILQLWMPSRTPAMTDALYNIAGLLIGWFGIVGVRWFVRVTGNRFSTMGLALTGLFLLHVAFVGVMITGKVGNWSQIITRAEWRANPFIEPFVPIAAGAFACIILLMARGAARNLWLTTWLLGGAIILLALTPIRPGQLPFQWQPFASLAYGFSYALGASLTWKFFSYAALAQALFRLRVDVVGIFVCLPMAVLLLEYLQTKLSSGSPDITEPIWALLCVCGVYAEWQSQKFKGLTY